jgi:hypothetical protein
VVPRRGRGRRQGERTGLRASRASPIRSPASVLLPPRHAVVGSEVFLEFIARQRHGVGVPPRWEPGLGIGLAIALLAGRVSARASRETSNAGSPLLNGGSARQPVEFHARGFRAALLFAGKYDTCCFSANIGDLGTTDARDRRTPCGHVWASLYTNPQPRAYRAKHTAARDEDEAMAWPS